MAPRSASVHIPQPCAESWAAMTPRGPGRHCAACQQTVVDFTQKTDTEVLALLKQAAGRTCGRFRAGQLDRPLLHLAAQGPSRWRAWLAAAVAVWGLREGVGAPAKAQAAVEQGTLGAPVVAPVARPIAAQPQPKLLVRGVVLDSATQEGIPGVTVLVVGTTLGVSTDATGHFNLEIPDSLKTKQGGQTNIGLSWVGYARQELPLSAFSEPVTVVMRPDYQSLGGIVVVGGYTPFYRPWPWHPRRFYYWSKYWLTQPFRRG